ncbi:hypothetical protein RI129_011334 [Pyrocoelia pectoralis]|uniref:Glycosyltransferase family 92 protein n=1 Tax=Pyrocoelia pectoralis TaxID=417401 RepID=A0AAN7ZIP2_9COLE
MSYCFRWTSRYGWRFTTKVFILFIVLSLVTFAIIQWKGLPLVQPTWHASINELPLIDNNPRFYDDTLIEDIQKRMPNLPIIYWNKNRNKQMRLNNSCARFPSIFELKYDNIYWQTLRTTNGTFHLFGAYLDTRRDNPLGATVRILGMLDRIAPTVTTYCQFWFDGKKEPVIVKSLEYNYIWHKGWGNYRQGIYQPYLISCNIPTEYQNRVPESISLVENVCDTSTNNVRVIYNQPMEKKDFAVCVKGLDSLHQDWSVRLVEWIELLSLLGADKIFFYELQVHPNMSKVLKYYENEGKIQVTPISLPGGLPNGPYLQHLYLTKRITNKRQNEVIPYNDCLYKHMYEYKYIVLLDVDEVIIPLNGTSWKELMEQVLRKALKVNKEARTSYAVRNVYFLDNLLHDHGWFDEIPRYMHMLQHVYRAKNFTGPSAYIKCFHNTDKVLTLHNHYPRACLRGGCYSYSIDTTDAQLQHYRRDCVADVSKSECEDFKKNGILDTTIWKFKQPLMERVPMVLRNLGYFPSS